MPPERAEEVRRLRERLREWAEGRGDVRALALVGSWARGAARAESDVDVILLTDDPETFTADDAWIEALPGAALAERGEWGAIVERRLRLPTGLEVEFGIGRPSWAATDPVDTGTRAVATPGMQVLHDPDGILAALADELASVAAMEHRDTATLERGLDEVRRAPRDAGTVELIVRRPGTEEREVVPEARLDPELGLVGDNWRERGSRATPDGSAHPDRQLTMVNARLAALVAGARERWALAGDQLYVDLDLSGANLPPGTRLQVGEATIEITDQPHTGCGKFVRRFGVDAMRFVNTDLGRELNLRGIYARVVTGGTVRVGDAIRKAG